MRTRTNDERGMSLIEMLIATAILIVAMLVALALYDAARHSFKKGENATVQQEAVRIAYDRLTADLRMLGYNANPDGDLSRPDEQLEVGLDHAIIFRGDFDAEDATKKNDVEGALAGGKFAVVSTGNDEVVGYVLSKPDGTGPDTITFSADVDDQPRNGNVTAVTVNNVVLNPTSPPYTLYKISLNNNVGTCCNNDFIVRTPVAEDIRNLTIQYFDPSSTAPIAAPGTAETAAAKALRAGVTRFNVSLIGMTKDPDMKYNDTTDPATRRFRKFELRGDVVPRNMRMKGVQDLAADTTPPTKPATPTLIPGHCGGLIVSWAANPSGEEVTQYRVNFGTTSATTDGSKAVGSSPYFLSGLTTLTTYYVTIQAMDDGGNISQKSNAASAAVANTNTPSAPTGPTATSNLTNTVDLNWNPVTTNTASVPAADPIAPSIRELAGYRIYRGDNAGVAATGTPQFNESLVHPPLAPPFSDTSAVNCHPYYYKVTAVDTCGTESAPSSAFSGQSTSSIAPMAPTNVQAFPVAAGHNAVTWTAVTKDMSDNTIAIKDYDVYRSGVMLKTDLPTSAVFPTSPIGTASGTTYDDWAAPAMTGLQTIYYRVVAKDECPNYSDPSSLAEPKCQYSGTLSISQPINGGVVAGPVPVVVNMTGGTDTYTGITITYTHATSGLTRTFTSATAGPTWTDSGWVAMPAGPYTITASVTNSTGCASTTSIAVNAGNIVGCCLNLYPMTTTTMFCSNGNAKCKEVSYRIANERCLTSVSLQSLTIGWTDLSNLKPKFSTVQFNGNPIAAPGSWTDTYSGTTPELGTATKSDFSTPSPQVPYTNPTNNGNATLVTYVFTKETSAGNNKADVFDTNTFVFILLDQNGNPSTLTTTCTLPSLTVK